MGKKSEIDFEFGFHPNPAYTFENFVEVPSNQKVKYVLLQVAQSVRKKRGKTNGARSKEQCEDANHEMMLNDLFNNSKIDTPDHQVDSSKQRKVFAEFIPNPIFIFANPGLGKTHLLHAIANYVKDDFLLISGAEFLRRYIYAVERGMVNALVDYILTRKIILFDDVHELDRVETKGTRNFFFHIFSTAIPYGVQFVVTSDRPPRKLKNFEERILSRFEGGYVEEIQPPSAEEKLAILRRKLQEKGFSISDDILFLIAKNSPPNIRFLEGVILHLEILKDMGMEITEDIVIRTLSEKFSIDVRRRDKFIKEIAEECGRFYGVGVQEIFSSKKSYSATSARYLLIYVLHKKGMKGYEIAKKTGISHPIVFRAIDIMKKRVQESPELSQIVEKIIQKF